jgi:hypothetical protein
MFKYWSVPKNFPLLRPIVAALLILSLYQILVFGNIIPSSDGINQFQTNAIKAERYVYDINPELKLAIAGSSLANIINPNYIGTNVANLGMAGGSTQTGLAIIQHAKVKPSIVLAEINSTIDRKIDENLVSTLFNPFLSFLRITLPIFRQEYRPVSVFVSALKGKESESSLATRQDFQDTPLRQQEIQRLIQENSNLMTEDYAELLQQQIAVIKTQIATLEAAGSRVILFELPGEPKVQETAKYQQIHDFLRSRFPADRYEWLPEPSRQDWITSDGLHLIRPDAKDYGAFLREHLLQS